MPKSTKLIRVVLGVSAMLFVAMPAAAWGAAKGSGAAPDFPPGQFSDGQRYSLSDFEGKVVVLFFYEQDCPRCRGSIQERNAVVQKYQGKPVRFFAIAAGDSLQQAKSYAGGTRLAMPVFADPLSLMEKRYDTSISLQNIWQFRVIGPDGDVVGHSMEERDIDRALAEAKPTFNPDEYHAKLKQAVTLFEWNQHAAGMKALKVHLKSRDKEVAESAAKLLAEVKAQGEEWISKAEGAADGEPVVAYDLYTRVASAFGPTDDLGKKAAEAAKKLKTNDAVKKELEARKMFEKVYSAMAVATPKQRGEVAKFAASVAKKYPDTPTAKKAEELQQELEG